MKPSFYVWLIVAVVGMFVSPWLIFMQAPLETTMGVIQKIFYFHVPAAWMLFLSVFVCAGGSLVYIIKRSKNGDAIAVAAGELAVLFGLIMLITGPLWARKAWGKWWVWDVRLTTSLLLWVTCIAYLFARKYAGPAGRMLAAGLSLFAAANVPLVYMSVRIWRTMHPQTEVVRSLDPGMRPAFYFSGLTVLGLWVVLLKLRSAQGRAELVLEEAWAEFDARRE